MSASIFNAFKMADDVQPTFGSTLFTTLRYQTYVLRQDFECDPQHFLRHCHFQIHARLQQTAQAIDIGILHVATVFAQMQRDAVRSRLFRTQGSLYYTGVARATRLTDSSHVIDIDTQFNHNGLIIAPVNLSKVVWCAAACRRDNVQAKFASVACSVAGFAGRNSRLVPYPAMFYLIIVTRFSVRLVHLGCRLRVRPNKNKHGWLRSQLHARLAPAARHSPFPATV